MTTWSRETIFKVSHLYSEITADTSLYNVNQRGRTRTGDVETHVRERVAKEFVDRCAKECDATVHPDDLVFVSRKNEDHAWLTTVKVRWQPNTNEIELRGGHSQDGLTLIYQYAPSSPLVMENVKLSKGDFAPVRTEELWEMSGWSEDRRHWVYSLTQSRPKE